MQLRIPFTVTVGDNKHTGAIRLVDAVAIERKFECSTTDAPSWPLDWMLFGAWNALRRAQGDVGEYDTFLESLDGFESEEEDDAPKEPGQAQPSSPSPEQQSSPPDNS